MVKSAQESRKRQVLMVVKTYPTPSQQYGELVCTAGIDIETGEWIRIYPYPFRQSDTGSQFNKYDIIEVAIEPAFPTDPRPDSWKLFDINSVTKIDHLDTKHHWEKRMKLIRPTVVDSVESFKQSMLSPDKQTWGKSILPVQVKSGSAKFSSEERKGEKANWTAEEKAKLEKILRKDQQGLFDSFEGKDYLTLLERIPYTFRLTFEDLTGTEYTYPILDWEIASLFRRYENPDEGLKKVAYKIEEEIFSTNNEVFLVLGVIHHRYKNVDGLAVDGFIYPKLERQPRLF